MYGYLKLTSNVPKNVKKYFKYSYCSLCKSLQKHYGLLGSLTLSYDVTVLSLLLINEKSFEPYVKIHCIGGKTFSQNDETFRQLASLNIFLLREKLKDNLNDEKKIKNVILWKIFDRIIKKAENLDFELSKIVAEQFDKFYKLEKENPTIIDLCNLFGDLMLNICLSLKMDEKYYNTIINISRWIYFIDVIDDYEKDLKTGEFNPLKGVINPQLAFYDKDNYIIDIYRKIFNPISENLNKIYSNEVVLRHILFSSIPLTTFYIMRKKRYVLY